jgi:hypothetical protein
VAGTTGLEPATSAVTGQRSNQLSYVPKMFLNNLAKHHVESGVSQLSPFSPASTSSLLWTQFQIFLDTKWTPNDPTQRQNQVYQIWCPRPLRQRQKVSYAPAYCTGFSFEAALIAVLVKVKLSEISKTVKTELNAVSLFRQSLSPRDESWSSNPCVEVSLGPLVGCRVGSLI